MAGAMWAPTWRDARDECFREIVLDWARGVGFYNGQGDSLMNLNGEGSPETVDLLRVETYAQHWGAKFAGVTLSGRHHSGAGERR